jgi:glycosyltransferase involved in cell wall biosynthesis
MLHSAEVLIVTEAHMPAGDAAAHRMHAIAVSLATTGLKVAVIGRGDEASPLPDGMETNISYCLWYAGRSKRERALCAVEHIMGGRVMCRVKALAGKATRAIICDHAGILFLPRLFSMARRRNIPVITDVTEWWWWLPVERMRSFLLLLVMEHALRTRYVIPRNRRVITVSRALTDFYRARGCDPFRLPPLLDLSEERWHFEKAAQEDGTMHILFAGSPDRERWDVILNGLIEANRRGIPVVLEVLGVASDRFRWLLGSHVSLLDSCGDRLVLHGRLPPEQVLPTMARAHLGILVRDDTPWSRGCFPSKVPELLALGVPLVFNPSSDLDQYLGDGKEGIRISEPTVECLVEGLTRAWELIQNGHWDEFRHSARQRAHASFDCVRYGSALRAFLGL